MTSVAVAGDARPIDYRFSFPRSSAALGWTSRSHLPDLPAGASSAPLQPQLSGSLFAARLRLGDRSPVGDDVDGTRFRSPIQANEWTVTAIAQRVRVRYRVSANTIDGTYAAIDATHAHLNMPAVVLWAAWLEHLRRGTHQVAPHSTAPPWQAATQLFPTDDPMVFTAPNLQYLMDSPIEFGRIVWRTFEAPVAGRRGHDLRRRFGIALHHRRDRCGGRRLRLRAPASSSRKRGRCSASSRLTSATPTRLLADYLPSARNDGMEHRNSTVLTSERDPCRRLAAKLLDTRRPRVLSRLERRANPAALARTLRLRARERLRRAVVRRGRHQLLRWAADGARRPVDARRSPRRPRCRGLEGRDQPGRPGPVQRKT